MVVMKNVRDRNLYYLKSSTVTGALTATVDSNNDATKLWYMRLGHMIYTSLGKVRLIEGC